MPSPANSPQPRLTIDLTFEKSILAMFATQLGEPSTSQRLRIDSSSLEVLRSILASVYQYSEIQDLKQSDALAVRWFLAALEQWSGISISRSYTPLQRKNGLFQVSTEEAKKIFHALRSNDTNQSIEVFQRALLPNLSANCLLRLEQDGDRYSLKAIVTPVTVDSSAIKRLTASLLAAEKDLHSRGPSRNYKPQNPYTQGNPRYDFLSEHSGVLYRVTRMEEGIGAIPSSFAPGYRSDAFRLLGIKLLSLARNIESVFGSGFSAQIFQGKENPQEGMTIVLIDRERETTYSIGLSPVRAGNSYDGIVPGIYISRASNSEYCHLKSDREGFERDLKAELHVVNCFVSWLYQDAMVAPESVAGAITLRTPQDELLGSLIQSKLLRRFDRGNSFGDLGGQQELKSTLQRLAARTIGGLIGRTQDKATLTILHGPTGRGKSSMSDALCMQFVEAGIPVYTLAPTETTAALLAKDISSLKNLFFYIQIHGGVLQIKDLELLLGKDPVIRATIETVLNAELEKTAKCPHAWVIADTEDLTLLRPSLINAHRLGNHVPVPLETDVAAIQELLGILLGAVDGEREGSGLRTPLLVALERYQIDLKKIAEYIRDINQQAANDENHGRIAIGLIPAQLKRIFGDLIDRKSLTNEMFLSEIDVHRLAEQQLAAARVRAENHRLQDQIQLLMRENSRLSDELAALQKRMGTVENIQDSFRTLLSNYRELLRWAAEQGFNPERKE